MTIRVLSVASEAFPLIKTGGLADVVGALPAALAPHGVAVTTLIPAYPAVLKAVKRTKIVHEWPDLLGVEARLIAGKIDGHPLLLIDAPALFAREGGPYGDATGKDWQDNGLRFAVLSKAAADIGLGVVKGRSFDLVHAHDWQAAMVPAYLHYAKTKSPRPKSVITIHNIAFQGRFEAALFKKVGLPAAAWGIEGVEYFGGVGFLKAGLATADAITTVSPTYAHEIRMAEFGMGLEGLIVARAGEVHGILNGIDGAIWNPATDTALAANYTSPSKRVANKRAVEKAFGLERGDGPLFIIISRLTWQKGMDLLVEALDALVGMGGRLAVLGSGDAALENAFQAAATRHPGRIAINRGYDEPLSHLMQGGGDAILIPSRFEPCGLTQLYGLAYGCVPIVARTGGLADSVIDANEAALAAGVATGLQFDLTKPEAITHVLTHATQLFARKAEWKRMQQQGMKADFSWGSSGARYAALYRDLLTPSEAV